VKHTGELAAGAMAGLVENELENDRGQHGGGDDHEDDRAEKRRGQQPQRGAFLGDNQRDLAARHHAHADLQRFTGGIARYPRADPAADHFGDHGGQQQRERKQKNGA